MKKRFWICLIIFVFGITSISCNKETESNKAGLGQDAGVKDVSEDTAEDGSKDDSADTPEDDMEEYSDEYSIYRNPIDKYFSPRIYSWDASQVEIREAQNAYKKAWKAEYKNVMKWLKKKCVYEEDKENIRLLEKSVAAQIKIEKRVLKTELIEAYKVHPDPKQAKNSISRISLLGHGTQERLAKSEGELYRDVCMRILNLGGYGEYKFKFRADDHKDTGKK